MPPRITRIRRAHVNNAKTGRTRSVRPVYNIPNLTNLFPVRLLETVHNKSLGRHAYRDGLARGLDS